jgi:hypothetical protein
MLAELATARKRNGGMAIGLEGCDALWPLHDVMGNATSSEQLSEGSIEGCVVEGDEGGSDAELIVRPMSLWLGSDDGDRGEGGGRD